MLTKGSLQTAVVFIMSHVDRDETFTEASQAVDDRSIDPSKQDSCSSDPDNKVKGLWGTPSGPQERLPGESIPDYYARRGFPVSSGKSGRAITLTPTPRLSATQRKDSADE
jgi:hypothetical protein